MLGGYARVSKADAAQSRAAAEVALPGRLPGTQRVLFTHDTQEGTR